MFALRRIALSPTTRRVALHRLTLSPTTTRAASTFNITYPNSPKPVFCFMSGCPGAGKTHALHRVYDLANVEILDLDQVIKRHRDYKKSDAHLIYTQKTAYNWADAQIEELFQFVLTRPNNENRIYALDGTGANYDRTIRRMNEAKNAGFWIVLLYVNVNVETALRRNARRNRKVPEEELVAYVPAVSTAVEKVLQTPLVDEFIELNNDEDDKLTDEERWGRFQERIKEESQLRNDFMDW